MEHCNTLYPWDREHWSPFWRSFSLFCSYFLSLFCGIIYPYFVIGLWSYLGWYLVLITPLLSWLELETFSEMWISLSSCLFCRDNLSDFSFSLSFLGFLSAFSCTHWMFFIFWILYWVLVRTSFYLFSFISHCFECMLCLKPLSLHIFCICIWLFLMIESCGGLKDLYLLSIYNRIKQRI